MPHHAVGEPADGDKRLSHTIRGDVGTGTSSPYETEGKSDIERIGSGAP